MLFASIRNTAASRPRRVRARLLASVEGLEVRSLLSSAAVIQWQMAPRFVGDPDRGGLPDLPNTSTYANPAGGFEVQLDASQSAGILPTTSFSWTVTDARGRSRTALGEDATLRLPEGKYRVRLRADGLAGTSGPAIVTDRIEVNDVLVVSIGDSYASGEGNPVVPGFYGVMAPQWAYSPDPAMNRENALAHRSTVAGPAQFALQLEQADPRQSVTFVSVANSGASIAEGVLHPMSSIGDPSVKLPAQIAELRRIVGGRKIDVLTISVGANDVGFASRVQDLISNTYLGSPSLQTIQTQVSAGLKALPGKYRALNRAIRGIKVGEVLVTDYPDLTRNERGEVAAIPGPLGVPLIDRANAEFGSSQIVTPLDSAVKAAVKANRWTYVAGIGADFQTHGYPSTSSWIRQLDDSMRMQGTVEGTFHPNAEGHRAIAGRLLAAYQGAGRKRGAGASSMG